MSNNKIYVKVAAIIYADGRMIPKCIYWEDEQKYVIDMVTEIKPAASMNTGGGGDRYTIQVGDKERYLWFERNTNSAGNIIGRWYVKRKDI